MVTMRPWPCAIMCGRTARIARYVPLRLTSMTRSQSASSCATNRPLSPRPAHVTRTSSPPSSRSARAASARMSSLRVTSARTPTARPRSARIAAAIASALSPRSATITPAPRSANARTTAPPMPPPPPVTMMDCVTRRSRELDADGAEAGEARADAVTGLHAQNLRDRSGHDDVAGAQALATRAEVVGDPRKRVERVAHHLEGRARAHDGAALLVDEPFEGQVEAGHRRQRTAEGASL